MKKEEIFEKITPIFAKVLEHNNFNLTETTTTNDVDGWGSLTHMIIIEEIEKEFNIKFKLLDLMNMDNVGDLVKAITSSIS
ncbi:acyl carrier protein [Flavivirga aquatica]|uniref:Acyl carrier protein n=1 Tax=Flavivirga aquatica TaxID=1849968 RepID=A0A1E5TAY7_9FLAO|nr:acyl carrier protein [Flavivirga aquatica]OEK08544.1 acyl carrier protein [Flavivirga aquatica]